MKTEFERYMEKEINKHEKLLTEAFTPGNHTRIDNNSLVIDKMNQILNTYKEFK